MFEKMEIVNIKKPVPNIKHGNNNIQDFKVIKDIYLSTETHLYNKYS